MRIKTLTSVIVGRDQNPKPRGWVGNVEDSEAQALITVGFAKETTEKLTDEVAARAKAMENATDDGDESEPKSEKDKGGAPQNKAK